VGLGVLARTRTAPLRVGVLLALGDAFSPPARVPRLEIVDRG
jgi:hypothetical protein